MSQPCPKCGRYPEPARFDRLEWPNASLWIPIRRHAHFFTYYEGPTDSVELSAKAQGERDADDYGNEKTRRVHLGETVELDCRRRYYARAYHLDGNTWAFDSQSNVWTDVNIDRLAVSGRQTLTKRLRCMVDEPPVPGRAGFFECINVLEINWDDTSYVTFLEVPVMGTRGLWLSLTMESWSLVGGAPQVDLNWYPLTKYHPQNLGATLAITGNTGVGRFIGGHTGGTVVTAIGHQMVRMRARVSGGATGGSAVLTSNLTSIRDGAGS